MAIRDGIKNAVASNIGAAVNKSVSSNLKRVAGNLFGVDLVPGRGSLGGPSAPIRTPTKYTTENLAYPSGVESDPTQGHYIIFEILAQTKGQLEAFKKKNAAIDKTRADINNTRDAVGGGFGGAATIVANRNNADAIASERSRELAEQKSSPDLRNSSIQMQNPTTTRLDTMIALYMPPSVKVNYTVNYGNQEIGILAESGLAAIKAFQAEQGNWLEKGFAGVKTAASGIGSGMVQMGMKEIADMGGIASGVSTAIAIERGQVVTPRMELMFEGMGRRNFSFSFTFIPKSEEEAKIVEQIVHKFKFHMTPDFADFNSGPDLGKYLGGRINTVGADGVREMKIPDHFNIRYMHMGEENPHLNKISTCALTSMDVDYGAERFTAYAGGRPQTTKISLNFTEFNIMSKSHVSEGY